MSRYLYQDIKAYVEEIARKHRNEPDYLLPSETQLMLKFSASRVTVRRALDDLAKANIIRKSHGRGSYPAAEETAAEANRDTTIALIQPYPVTKLTVDITNGAATYCYTNGLKLVSFFSLGKKEWESRAIATALDLHCAGILLMPLETQNYSDTVLQLSLQRIPTVFIDRKLYGLDFPYVASDHHAITYNAVEYFADRGHREICFVSDAQIPSSVNDRMEGYEDALLHRFGHIKKHSLFIDYNPLTIHDIMYRYFSVSPEITAIICASGEIATMLIHVMKELGRFPEKDFELILIDEESHVIGDLLDAEIPFIAQDGFLIGATAAEIVHQWVRDGAPQQQSVMIPTTMCFSQDTPPEIAATAPRNQQTSQETKKKSASIRKTSATKINK